NRVSAEVWSLPAQTRTTDLHRLRRFASYVRRAGPPGRAGLAGDYAAADAHSCRSPLRSVTAAPLAGVRRSAAFPQSRRTHGRISAGETLVPTTEVFQTCWRGCVLPRNEPVRISPVLPASGAADPPRSA